MSKILKLLMSLLGKNQKTQQLDKDPSLDNTFTSTKITPIEGYPFALVEKEPGKNVIVFGNKLISNNEFHGMSHAKNFLARHDWPTILNVCGIFTEEIVKQKLIENSKN